MRPGLHQIVNNDKRIIWFSVGLFFLILIADRISKYFVLRFLQDKPIHLFPYVDLVFVTNKGIVFGFFSNTNFNFLILNIVSLVFISFMMIYWFKPIPYPIIAMILAGGIGNMADRLLYGYVVDFIKIYHFYVFNIADASITVSVLLFLWLYLFRLHGKNPV